MEVKILHGHGNHLMIEGYSLADIGDTLFIKKLLVEMKDKIKMTAISEVFVMYHKDEKSSESGVTGTIFLSTSNITIHTYPSKKYISIDVYSCNEFEYKELIEFLKDRLKIDKFDYRLIRRGEYGKS